MKKIRVLLAVFLMMFFNRAFAAYQLYADIDGISLPYGTKLEMVMGHDVKSVAVVQGDMFEAHLAKDIYINNKLILPSNTVFRGRITGVKYSRALSRPASLYLTCPSCRVQHGEHIGAFAEEVLEPFYLVFDCHCCDSFLFCQHKGYHIDLISPERIGKNFRIVAGLY